MELFTKVVDDEGKESYEAYTPSTTDLSDEDFYKDERYTTVADRDAKRRIKTKVTVDQVKALGFIVDDEGNVTKQVEQIEQVETDDTPPPVKVPTIDELYAEFTKRQKRGERRGGCCYGSIEYDC